MSQHQQRQAVHHATARDLESASASSMVLAAGSMRQHSREQRAGLAGRRQDFVRALQSPPNQGTSSMHDRLEALEALLASLTVLDMSVFMHTLKRR